jgi:hypothetical protein
MEKHDWPTFRGHPVIFVESGSPRSANNQIFALQSFPFCFWQWWKIYLWLQSKVERKPLIVVKKATIIK